MDSHLLSGAFSKRDTPSSFPNLEVKPLSSDDTALYESGKVGQCRLLNKRSSLIIYYSPFFISVFFTQHSPATQSFENCFFMKLSL